MKLPRGGFQRWPRTAQTAYIQFILLLGIAFGAAGGPLVFWVAAGFTFALWLGWIAKSHHKWRPFHR